ncbi:ion channel [Gleimia sp. 6138-11-ORH1]|uniref:ion channel n=1 Tax=Gleimia sp. 6138-11-ORH1 TaxID=2973937 RepID=UPI002168A3D0|nr:ion channel [Gleimia sp. 6138-11-ORH1]MCS4484118.1 ion channel [Gleimia sp. 6138-11-ORH1]
MLAEEKQAENNNPFGEKLAKWERITQWPLAIAALIVLALYGYQVLYKLRGSALENVEWLLVSVWFIFVVDYLVRLKLAENKWGWIRSNLLDLASVALPFLRPLRLLRLVTLISVLQRTSGEALRNRIISNTVGTTLLFVIVSSLAILDVERDYPDASITTYPDALWWSLVTITTVGYGDYTPVSPTGRFITLGLMLGGITLIGVITASLASWITDRAAADNIAVEEETTEKIETLQSGINTLQTTISSLQKEIVALETTMTQIREEMKELRKKDEN